MRRYSSASSSAYEREPRNFWPSKLEVIAGFVVLHVEEWMKSRTASARGLLIQQRLTTPARSLKQKHAASRDDKQLIF
jgi:hypothetical protein